MFSSHSFLALGKIAILPTFIVSISDAQTWRDTLQFAKVTGIGISREGYRGDVSGNNVIEKTIRSRIADQPTPTQRIGISFEVTTTNDTGNGSLRKAISDANANAGLDMITFNILPAGPKTITPLSKLPNIIDPVTIDGTTQPVFVDKPMIELNCSSIALVQALDIFATSTIRGLAINRLTGGTGIVLWGGSDGSVIEGNFFGTDTTGTVRVGNAFNGVIARSLNNRIGGISPTSKNVFAGHGNPCIAFTIGAGGDLVQGNFMGTDVTGTVRLGTVQEGIIVINGSANDTIGGTAPGARNIISGSETASGISIVGTGPGGTRGIQVMGNYIGTDVTGMVRFNNAGNGIFIRSSPNNVIGGTNAAARNVISGNTNPGIFFDLSGATNNIVQGNFIGTKANGVDTLGNSKGVVINSAPNNTIGGATAGAGNIISGNSLFGVEIRNSGATGNKVQHNFIGTNAAGTLNLGNGSYGVIVNASQDTIGGLDTSKGNIIAYNRAGGVYDSSGTGNMIRMNRIFSNPNGLGIDLAPKGITPNDSLDLDSGPNNKQNFPLLDSATVAGGNTTIHGRFNSLALSKFYVDFFSNTKYDSSHFGEGETYIGSTTLTTGISGNDSINVVLPLAVPLNRYITATAIDSATGNTSEFSQALCLSDSDADGIMDCWETQGWGIDVNSDAVIDLDLYALGARVQHKDLFVEVDAMNTYTPPDSALKMVVQSFSVVPNLYLNNPDGQAGIGFHYVLDDTTIPVKDFQNVWVDFDSVKKQFFGTQAQRTDANARYILEAKHLVYRYCIFARTFVNTTGDTVSSGKGELTNGQGGNDFMVTFGSTGPRGWKKTRQLHDHAGTFMHELGHTLGLWHGGNNNQNYKPNYYSVMNYTWQTIYNWQRPATWRLNYSPVALRTLNESSLNETVGLSPPAGVFPIIISVPFTDSLRNLQWAHLMPATATDWTGNGDSTNTVASADINLVGEKSTVSNPGDTLNGFADWPNLIYNFRHSPNFKPGVHARIHDDEPEELTKEVYDILNSLPPPKPIGRFIMDGVLDTSGVLLSSNAGIDLYARYKAGQLYVATNSAQSQAADMFIFISDAQNPLRGAPAGKTGQVAAWTVYLGNESSDNSSGWSDETEAALTNITIDTAGTVLEGVVDIWLLYGRVPTELFIAVGKYGTNAGGALLAQVPLGNGDGNIDPGELFPFTDPALPIQLASFTAHVVVGVGVHLDWLTISEINNYGFEVQRKSESEQNFLSLPNSFIPGHGTTNEPHAYSYTDTTVTLGRWHYRLKQIDLDGTVHFGPQVSVHVLTGVEENTLPTEYALHQNYPNPFNPFTVIKYDIPQDAHVTLKLYDVLGREVKTLVDEIQGAGFKSTSLDASKFSSGVYFYRLDAGGFTRVKKLLLLK